MRRRGSGLLCIAAGVLLLLGAIGLACYNVWDESRAAASAYNTMAALDEMIQPTAAPAPEDYADLSGEVWIPDHILDPKMDLPTMEVNGKRYVGYLEIPALDLKLPVLEEWSYPNLKLSACRYTGSPYQDNMVIAAHNYTRHFGRLDNLVAGDEVHFIDVDGNVFVYHVLEQEQLAPRPVQAMLDGDWDLSLFTCTMTGQSRLTVRCLRAW